MVYISRPAQFLLRPASRRAISTSAARSVISPHASPSLRAGVTSRTALASKITPSSASLLRGPILHGAAPASTRLLTTAREKVKVLAVLYDGGQHAIDVSQPLLSLLPNPNFQNPQIPKSPKSRDHIDQHLVHSPPIAFCSVLFSLQRRVVRSPLVTENLPSTSPPLVNLHS